MESRSAATRRRFTIRAFTVALIVCLSALLGACASEPSVDVAPEVKLELIASQTPTIRALKSILQVDGAKLPTLAASPPTPTEANLGFGAIIRSDYQQPPTSTARPSEPPAATPVFSQPTQPGRAITTAVPIDQTRLDGAQMGIQVHYNFDGPDWSRTLRQIAALRVGWIKLQANWKWLQPERAGQFDRNFRLFQLHVQEADKRGFKILLSIAKAPDWARHVDRSEDGPPDDLNQLAWFIQRVMEKLGPHIDAVEIWNEPNLKREWTGIHPLGGANYMELFRIGYDAVRAYSPHITIVTAGLAPTGNHSGLSVDDRAFLRQMYQAGLARYSDVKIGIHPYSWGNPPDFLCCDNVAGQGWDDQPQFFFLQTIRDYSNIIAAYNDNAQMWVTEFGWATWEDFPNQAPETWMAYNSALDQRNYTLRAFEIGQLRANIDLMFLWNLSYAQELTVSQRSELAAYSILYPRFDGSDGQRERPLYRALATRP
ncbi:MAG: hypothetical protein OXG84_03590 [Chloroflexi bacterium]|nr:hypothetical protein [Chloroflexota bacterium]